MSNPNDQSRNAPRGPDGPDNRIASAHFRESQRFGAGESKLWDDKTCPGWAATLTPLGVRFAHADHAAFTVPMSGVWRIGHPAPVKGEK